MEFRILGPLEVGGERGALALGGAKPRALLAVLLLHPNQPVSPDRLALALWGEDAPAGATKTVQVHVSRLRKALGDPGIVETTPAGYRLRVRAGELDAERFARDVEAGRRASAAGRPEEAAALLRAALALWRGPPLADLGFEPFAQTEIARLEEQRLEALELRVEADLAAGRHVALIGELRQLAAEHPARERLAAQLMLALYRGGRQAEALEAYRDARRALVEAAGVEPGPELQRLQEAVLDHDPALELAAGDLPAELDPAAAPPLVGREAELVRLREEWEGARAGAGRLVALCGPEGMGKTRLAAELAAEVHQAGAVVRYATANGAPAAVLAALDGVRRVAGPTLLVVDDADRAGGDVPDALAELAGALADVPALVLVNGRDPAENGAIRLGPLDAEAVAEIASGQGVPAGRLLEASGGVPRRAHEVVGRWAREQAARRVDAAAGRTAAGRARLRSMEAELTGGVLQLQAVQERDKDVDEDAAVVCPFKGLASFDVTDAPNFFGRERLVAELVARLVGAPLLGIVGASGSGKSSVLRAGLLPALANGVLPGSETWTQVLMRPGEHPLRELGRAVAGIEGRVLLAVDQFEETFTACRDEQERGAFVDELAGGPRTVVVAVRADFYGRCAAYPALSARLAAHHVLVGAMRRDELRRFSPDGTLLASASIDRTVRLWDVRARRPSGRPLEGHPEQVTSVDFSPDGTTLASAGSYGDGEGWRIHSVTVRLWDVASRRPLGRPLEPRAAEGVRVDAARAVNEVEFSPDGALLALAEAGGTVGVWDVATRRLARLLTGHGEWVLTVAFSPDGRTLASGSADGTVRLWDARSGRPVGRALEGHSDEVLAMEFSPDGGTLASGGLDETVRLWSVATGRSRGVLRPDDDRPTQGAVGRSAGVQGLAFAPSGGILASAGEDGQVHLWDVRARGPLGRPLLGHDGWVRALAFTSGRTLASGGVDGTLRFWDAGARRPVGRPVPHPGLVLAAAATADGSTVATAGEDGTVRLWDAESRTPLGRPLAGHGGAVKAVAVSPDGRTIASGGRDATVRLWDVDTHRPLGPPLPSSVGAVNGVAFDADGATLAAAGSGGRVGLWDVESRDRLGALTGPVGFVNAVAFGPDGETVAGVGQDGSVWLWDLESRRPLGPPLAGHTDVLQSVAFAPDGATLASAGADRTVRLWDVATRQPLGAPLEGHTGWVSAVAFSPDGTRLASAGEDGTIRLWDALLWSDDRTALERRICGALQRNLTRAEWTEFLPGQPYRETCPGAR